MVCIPLFTRVLYIPGDAGFPPATVVSTPSQSVHKSVDSVIHILFDLFAGAPFCVLGGQFVSPKKSSKMIWNEVNLE